MNCAECLESWDCVRSGDVASGAMCTGGFYYVDIRRGARAERTRNMAHIVVTSDVSKSSGWL